MRRMIALPTLLVSGLFFASELAAQAHAGAHSHRPPSHASHSGSHDCLRNTPGPDSTFAALQERGKVAMGVDQYTSTHRFDSFADGGRIEYLLNTDDPQGIARIRAHLRQIVEAFSQGDFSTPAFVHAQEVPGTAAMAAHRDRISYAFRELPRGGEIRLITSAPEALRAIHDFMAFQRQDHRADGHTH